MTRLSRVVALASIGALLAAFLWPASSGAADLPSGFQEEVLFGNLLRPVNLEIAPDGRTFVALKNGEIVVFPAGSGPGATPVRFADLRKQVFDSYDRGILGMALDPGFDLGRPYVYVLYSYDHVLGTPGESPAYGQPSTEYEGDPCPSTKGGCVISGRLVRLTAQGDQAVPSAAQPDQDVLIESWCQQFTSHTVGDLKFGPEGALFLTAGDGASYENPDYGQYGNPCGDPPGATGEALSPPKAEGGALRAQSVLGSSGRTSLDGSLLRIDPDTGLGWPGNPFAASSDPNARRIFAFGFRNPFRFALDPRGGAAYVDNVGASTWEEIDRVPLESSRAYNSGWPCFEGDTPNPQYQALGLDACQRLYSQPGSTRAPFFLYNHGSRVTGGDPCAISNGAAIAGTTIYEGSSFPAKYDRALFFGDSVRGCIYAMLADSNGEPDPTRVEPFLTNSANYPGVDLAESPGGDLLYAHLGAGTITRIFYDPGAPNAVLSADRKWGKTPLAVNFSAASSSGEDGHPLSYAWDLDGDGQFDDGDGATRSRTYETAQNVVVGVEVTDLVTGKSSKARLTVYPGDTPPQVQITAPLSSREWSVGEPIEFAGSAVAQSGPVSLYWRTGLLHCPFNPNDCHEHPLQVFPRVAAGTVTAPNHEFPSYVSFILTATDSRGLSNEASVRIAARPVTLQLRSSPPGIALTAGIANQATPFDLQVIEGSPTTIAAPATATVDGVEYGFAGWSDGGARAHAVPGADAAYMATYVPLSSPGATSPTGAAPAQGASPSQGPGGSSLALRRRLVPRIATRPHKVTSASSARFVFSSAADRFQCRLDGGDFSPCRSPRVYRRLADGVHAFRVRPVDDSGAPLTKATAFSWKIVAG